jgi:glycosyltransferase A (GT-A) superfamily protein (DUF2064 family)
MSVRVLLVAKAPVAGHVKTRLAATVGDDRAAELAAAALLDTMRTCTAAFGPEHCRLALHGDLNSAVLGGLLAEAAAGWTVLPQRGDGFAERLAHAHLDIADEGPAVQIGMDTPQVSSAALVDLVSRLEDHDAVLADAEDGGWWALGLADPRHGAHLADVPMSTPTTGPDTRQVLQDAGLSVGRGAVLRDVDTEADADAVAAACAPGSEFARRWAMGRVR